MTFDDAMKAVDDAMAKAHAEAKKFYGPKMTGPTSPIVDRARITVIETTLAGLMAERSAYLGESNVVAALELRDYWEAVAEEVKSR